MLEGQTDDLTQVRSPCWSSIDMTVELLSQATGYGVIVGLSFLFCAIILICVRLQKRYLSEDSDQSEMASFSIFEAIRSSS